MSVHEAREDGAAFGVLDHSIKLCHSAFNEDKLCNDATVHKELSQGLDKTKRTDITLRGCLVGAGGTKSDRLARLTRLN